MPPYNGSGTYTLTAGQPVVAGTDILDSTFNTLTADLATALSTCVTRDGQSPPTANLPMGSFKLTGLSAGTAAGHSVRFEQLQTGVNKLITVAGTGDVITGTMTPTYTAYATGDIFSFVVGLVNTTNVTINIDGLGAKAITVNGSTALVAGSLPANKAVLIEYDGTRFQLLTDNYVGAATGTLAVANGGTGVTTSTGSGANVLGTSPTLTTPTISTITSAAATALTLQSASTTAVTIDTSQNVGIGTSSPTQKLQVNGNILLGTPTRNQAATPYIGVATSNDPADNSRSFITFATTAGASSSDSYIAFNTNQYGVSAGERMRINSSGNVGIGTSTLTSGVRLISYNATNGGPATSGTTQASGAFRIQSGNNAICDFGVNGTTTWIQAADQTGLNTNYDIALQPNGGNLLVGTTTLSLTPSIGITVEPTGAGGGTSIGIGHPSGTPTGNYYTAFAYNGSPIGSITQAGTTGVLYNVTSDYRLKNEQQPLTGAKDFVMALQPKKWQWWDGSGEGIGFIAHEFMQVAKHSGNGEKDTIDADGKPVYQSIQPSSSEVMANLVAFIQEQQALIIQLQADVAALKR